MLTIAYRTFGSVPEPGALADRDAALLAEIDGGFATVGDADRERTLQGGPR